MRATMRRLGSELLSLFRSCRPLCRAYAVSASGTDPVELSAASFSPKEGASKPSIIFLHGLFGNKKNAATICRDLAQTTRRDVHALDLRNHGESPHAEPMDYASMAGDVAHFLKSQGLEKAGLIGHSMGGKAAMTLALQSPELVERLIVVDITPATGSVQGEFKEYVKGMQAVDQEGPSTRKEADAILSRHVESQQIRLFLMTNWKQSDNSAWRIPIDLLEASFDAIGDFPFTPKERAFDGPTLFIKGEKSKYINRRSEELARTFFPSMELEVVKDAAHWVHSDKPKEFKALVNAFFDR